jgi:hypothetical protein
VRVQSFAFIAKLSDCHHITVTNTPTAILMIGSVTLDGANVPSFSITNGCSGSIAVGATCTINAFFIPAGDGPKSASVIIASNATASPLMVSLAGTGGIPAPAITASATSLASGTEAVGFTTGATAALAIAPGFLENCAASLSSGLYCWGLNGNGQIGDGTVTGNAPYGIPTPVAVLNPAGTAPIGNIASLSGGQNDVCAVALTGDVFCWGDNTYGEFGNNATGGSSSLPVQVLGVGDVGFLRL